MKTYSILLLALLGFSGMAYAQKGKVAAAVNYEATGDLDAAKEAIDGAVGNEKSNTWPKTYIVAAKVYTALQRSGKDASGIDKAMDYYKKAIELDAKGDEVGKGANKFAKEIKLALTMFGADLTNAAVENFSKEDFNGALGNFESLLWTNQYGNSTYTEVADSVIIWNAALAAYNGQNWSKASNYLEKCVGFKYPGADAVLLLNNVYTSQDDKANLESNLKRGLEYFPQDQRILTTLIQHYLNTQQNEAALDYLRTAIQNDPTNPSFYYAQGVLFEATDKEKAIEKYLKSLELDPKFFNSLYNLGVIYYNIGVEASNKANDLTDLKAFEKAKAAADDLFKKALPYMERAYEIQPTEPAVLESLKSLYYRFEMMDKYNEIKTQLESL